MTSFACLLAWVLIVVTLPIVFLLWLSESQQQRIRRQRRQGWTLQRIANYHHISVTTVRRRLA